MTATQAPTPGPLSGSVGCAETPLQDLLRRVPKDAVLRWEIPEEGRALWQLGSASSPVGSLMHRAADQLDAFRLAPTAPVEASGSEREHGPKCWGKTSFSDEMMYCYCGSTDSPPGEMREAVLKGVGKVNGDGWKDTTTKGETVFVWNAEKPAPYAPGQYPRVGNEGWSASTLQYDFTPAAADDVPAILAALSTTPARAEAQDEGAAGEPVGDGMPIGEGFLYRTTMTGERHIVHEATGFTIAKLPYDYRYTDNATQKSLADKIVALYAHPSPPPAADEDRVLDEAAKYLKAQYGASYGRDHPRDRARIKNALKSEGQS